jgi:hypothetical protein
MKSTLVALQFQVAFQGMGQQLHGGDQDSESLREQGYGGAKVDFHDIEQEALGISG